jgi:hypothetical protein
MAIIFRAQVDGSGNPIFASHTEAVPSGNSASRGLALGLGSNTSTQGLNITAALGVRSSGENTGFQTLYGAGEGFAAGLGENSGSTGEQIGDGGQGFAVSLGENTFIEEFFGEAAGFGVGLGECSGSISTVTPIEAEVIAQAVEAKFPALQEAIISEITTLLPALVNDAVRTHQIRPGLSVDLKEYLESGAVLGKHTEGKVLPGTAFPIAPGTLQFYMDPLEPTKKIIEYTIDANGNRVVLAFFDQDGNRIQVATYP